MALLESIFSGVGADAVTTFAKRTAGYLASPIKTQLRLRRSLRTRSVPLPEEENAKRIIAAITKAVGNSGILNERFGNALDAVSSSGIVEHLVLCAQASVEPEAALRLLIQIYNSTGEPQVEEAKRFADAIWQSIQIATGTDDDVSEPRIRTTITNQARRIETRIATILNEFEAGEIEISALSPAQLGLRNTSDAHTIRDLAHATLVKVNEVDVHGAGGNVIRVKLNDVYVTTPVGNVSRSSKFFEYQEMRVSVHQAAARLTWDQILEFSSQTVLLGDPGGGKSTLSKKICLELAQHCLKGGMIVPTFIQLRAYAAAQSKNPHLQLLDFVFEHLRAAAPAATAHELRTLFSYLLGVGRSFIVFDGLDEVLTDSERADIAKQITQITEKYPLSRFLITSRFVGYNSNSLPDFAHIGVSALDLDSQRELFDKVAKAILNKKTYEIDDEADKFFSETQRKARELATNPLMLTLLIIIHDRSREIPDNRSDLYSACADLLFERWDSYRNITPDLPERYRINDLLKHIAYLFSEKEELGGRLSKSQLRDVAKKFFIDDYNDNREGKAAEAAHKLVEHLTTRAWILQETGSDVFEFTHRTFLEYFFARHIESKYEITEELVAGLADWIKSGEKTLPCHLAIQLRVKDKRDASGKAAVALVNTLEAIPVYRVAEFSANAVDYLLPYAEDLKLLADKVGRASLDNGWSKPIVVLLDSKNPLSEVYLTDLIGELASLNKVAHFKTFSELIDYFAGPRFRECHPSLYEKLINGWALAFEKLLNRSPYASKVWFDLTGRISSSAIKKHGVKIWGDLGAESKRIDSRISDAERMLSALEADASGAKVNSCKHYLQLATQVYAATKAGVREVRVPRDVMRFGPTRRFELEISPEALTKENYRRLVVATMIYVESLSFHTRFAVEAAKYTNALIQANESHVSREAKHLWSQWINGKFRLFKNSIDDAASRRIAWSLDGS